eukprot:5328044-Prymnesium_polylepis.1
MRHTHGDGSPFALAWLFGGFSHFGGFSRAAPARLRLFSGFSRRPVGRHQLFLASEAVEAASPPKRVYSLASTRRTSAAMAGVFDVCADAREEPVAAAAP